MTTMSQKKFKTYDIYVGNLPPEYDQKNVTRMFSKIGEINAVIMRENNGQKYAYVRFISESDAENACEKNGTIAEGRRIVVRRSEAKKKNPEDSQEKKTKENDSAATDWNPDADGAAAGQSKESEDKAGATPGKGKGRGETMMITHVESPVMYWGQGATDTNMAGLLSVATELKQLCPAAPTLTSLPELNKVYGAKFSEDDNWYRCQVVVIKDPKRVKIQYIDYGNYEEVNPDTLVELPSSMASLRPFAQKCLLHEILPAKRNDQVGIEFVRNLLENQYVQVVARRRLADQKGNYVDIYMGDVFLNEKIVESGYGVRRNPQQRNNQFGPPMGNSGPNSGPGGGFPMSGYGGAPAPNFVIGGGFGSGDADSMNSIALSSRFPAMAEPGKMPFMGFDSSVPPPPAPDRATQAELSAKSREVEVLRAEKEKSSMEVQLLRNKMKSLQGEYAQVSKMMENSFSSLMQQSFELKQRVKSLRCQFPTASQQIPLDEVISLATDEALECEVPASIHSAIALLVQYNKTQVDIFKCSSMEEMTAMLEPRNELRHEVHEHLCQGIDDLEAMPLTEKKDTLKRGLEILGKHYGAYFKFNVQNSPALDTLIQGYKQFRDEKIKRFEETRKATDEVQRNLKAVFTKIQMSLDLDQEPEVEGQESLGTQLESMIKLSNQALQREIQASDIENSSEGCLMAALVQGLEKSLRLQLVKVEELFQKLSDFRHTRDSIHKWLSASPSVQPIQEIRKKLRGLKSKLRHRLADLEDAVESGDAGAVQTIKDDIAAIRLDIHKTLIAEDKELTLLTSLADNHFPELLLQHPDLGIKAFKDNGCMVKPSLEPDHLDMQPVPGVSAALFQSTFADTPVLVREHLLGDADRVGKEDFLKELRLYAKTKKLHLQHVQAVFFDKNSRHAYVKTSKSGELLCNFVAQQGRCSNEMIQQMFGCLVSAVMALHTEGLLHGEVTPENVLVLPNGGAVLMEPDFSRSRLERSRRRYVSPNGLEFLSPELRSQSTSTGALFRGDCYNLGMLLVWLHCPDQGLHFLPNGLPNTGDALDSAVLEVLSLLMTPNPKLEQGLDNFILMTRYLGQPGQQTPRTLPSPLPPDTTPSRPRTSQSAMMERAALMGQQCRTPTPPQERVGQLCRTPTPPTRATPSPPSQVPAAPPPQLRSFLPQSANAPPPRIPPASDSECIIDTFDPSLADNLPASTASLSEEAPISESSGWDPEPFPNNAAAPPPPGNSSPAPLGQQILGRRLQPMQGPLDVAAVPALESSAPAAAAEQLAGSEDGDQAGENGWGSPDPGAPDSGTGWDEDGVGGEKFVGGQGDLAPVHEDQD